MRAARAPPSMIDRIARDQFTELFRHFAAGNLTNDQYEEAAHRILQHADGGDAAVGAIFSAAWYLYDDLSVHWLCDRRALTGAGCRAVARWILFLYVDFEYEWPIGSMISRRSCLLRLCTLGLAGLILTPINNRRMRRLGLWELLRGLRNRLKGSRHRGKGQARAEPLSPIVAHMEPLR
jgi:hypothetical protein